MLKTRLIAEAVMLLPICIAGQWLAYALAVVTLPNYTWAKAYDMGATLWFMPLVLFVILFGSSWLQLSLAVQRAVRLSVAHSGSSSH